MNNVFTKELIFDRIKDSGFPFWGLYLSTGFNNRTNVMQYWGSDFAEDDSDETKIEKSIRRLDNIVTSFPEDSIFIIEIRNSKQTNGNGVLGPFMFSEKKNVPESEKSNLAAAMPPAGYVPEDMLKGIESRLTQDFENRLNAYKAEVEAQRKEDDYQRRLQDLEAKEKELKEQKKGYESGVAKTADTVMAIVERLGAILVPGLFGGDAQAVQLASTQSQPQLGETTDPKAEIVEKISDLLYTSKSDAELKQMLDDLKQKDNGNMETSTGAEPTATGYNFA